MKKLMTALAILASVTFASGQNKNVASATKALEVAQEAAQNAKKATKAATWLTLGQSYLNAYSAPAGSLWAGATKQDLKLIMGDEKPSSVENVTIVGQQLTKEVYSNKELYFNPNGQLAIINVTKPVVENGLEKALEAYKKAFELDPKKVKEVTAALQDINKKYIDEAYNKYSLGNGGAASDLFAKAAEVKATAPLSQIDTNAIYNAGFTAWWGSEFDKAKPYFEKCAQLGYLGEDGETYAKLADIAQRQNDSEGQKKWLEEGFKAYPQSQSILIGLINYYVSTGQDTNRLFELIHQAQANEPTNASLYYVEGNTQAKLGNEEAAVAAYEKCATVDPKYAFGYIGEGILFYNKALEIQDKAQAELDDAKYMALVKEFEVALKKCIPVFENAYKLTTDDKIKVSVAEYLKNANYRFRDEDATYKDAYEKYAKVVETGKPE